MKKKSWISFDAEPIPGEAAAILVPTNCGPDVAEVNDYTIGGARTIRVSVKLDQTDPRVAKVLALLQQHNVEPYVTSFDEYSDEDLQNARLLLPRPVYYGDDFITITLWNGTKYDLTNACPNCGTGAKQISPVYIDKRDMKILRKHRVVEASSYSLIVDGGIRKKLVDAGVSGISFGDVRMRHDNGKWSEVARDQVFATHTLPPMHGALKERDEQSLCKLCRRGGGQYGLQTFYRAEDLVGMQDVNLTWEWFGEFRPEDKEKNQPRFFGDPCLLVTPKVMNIFNKAGVKSFEWLPINVID